VWSAPQQLPLRELQTFAKGQDITFDLAGLDDSEPAPLWRWKVADGEYPLISPNMHHCRLAFILNNLVVDDFSFVTCDDNHSNLLLLGENRFGFAREWRKRDGQS
jgi:hypothetical protein